MKKLLNVDVIDIVPFSKGLIYAKKDNMPDGRKRVSYFSYDAETGEIVNVTKNVFLLNKFGLAFEPISAKLADLITCEAAKLPNQHTIVMYPTGEMGHFDDKGKIVKTGDLYYNSSPARDAAFDGSCIWCAVPGKNAVIRYSLASHKIIMRIGGDDNTAFNVPISVAYYPDGLYVCNQASCEIRKINIDTLDVSDYLDFDEPVNKYFRFKEKEIVVLKSGIYEL